MRVFTRSGSSDSTDSPDAPDAGEPDAAPGTAARDGGRLRAVGVALGLTVAAVFVSIVVGVAVVVPSVLLQLDVTSTPSLLVLSAVGQLGFVGVAYAYARYRRLRIRVARPDRSEITYAAGGTLAALALAIGLSLVLDAAGLLPGSVIGEAAARDPTLLLGLAALSVVLVAPAEEFLFRGVVQGRLRQSFGPVGAVAGASLLFGSTHLANYTGALGPVVAGALLIVVTGSVLGSIYERTGNLAVPILAHATYNVALLLTAYLAG